MSGTRKKESSIEEAGLATVERTIFCLGARSEAERRLKRKLDSRLMSIAVAICLMNYIDVSHAALP